MRFSTTCVQDGCGRLVRRGYCDEHERARPSRSTERISGQAWQRIRRRQLRTSPLCYCGQLAEVVDHIVPLFEGGEPRDPANLQSLCRHHHDIKTREEYSRRLYGE